MDPLAPCAPTMDPLPFEPLAMVASAGNAAPFNVNVVRAPAIT